MSLSRPWRYALIFLILLTFALIRLRLRDIPLERDEGEYAYAGQLILQGIPPYQLAYNMKLPGTYAAYAVILALFGQTPAGIHMGLMLVNAATALLVYMLAARLFGHLAGIIACASFALLSTSSSVLGLAAHATHFVLLPALAGILVLLKAMETRRLWLFFASGVLAGLAFLMKQPGIFFVLFAGLYLLTTEWKHPMDWRGLAKRGGLFFLGAALPFGLTCFLLLRAGLFQKFWFWTFVYAREYGLALGILDGAQVLWLQAPIALGSSAGVWAIAGVGLTAFLWHQRARTRMIFLAGFLLFSFLAVCPSFYFRQHYFILMLPAVSLLAGVAISAATERLSEKRENRILRFLPVLAFLLACAYSLFQQGNFFFAMDPLAACRSLYAPNPFPEAPKIADYLKSHTSESARIAVLGSEPEIYFYSHRHAATGYIYVYPMMEEQKYALTMQKEMIAEMEAASPEYIVYVNVPFSWVVRPNTPPLIFAWAGNYLRDHYERVGIVDLAEPTQYRWDEEAKTYHPVSPNTVHVFKRKPS